MGSVRILTSEPKNYREVGFLSGMIHEKKESAFFDSDGAGGAIKSGSVKFTESGFFQKNS
jgi:hypothetical protein